MDTLFRSWNGKPKPTFTRRIEMKQINRVLSVFAVLALLVTVNSFAAKMEMHTSSQFQGPKANTGTVSHYVENGKSMLKVSEDFKVPDTPSPTWRVVDSKGDIYTLDAFKIKAHSGQTLRSAKWRSRPMSKTSRRSKSTARGHRCSSARPASRRR